MTEEKKLFDKSMEELREAFVRARFAEEKVFGRPDVEEWLAKKQTDYYPYDPNKKTEKEWDHFPPRGHNKARGYGLNDFATFTEAQGLANPFDDQKFGWGFQVLRLFKAPLFLGRTMAILQNDPTWQSHFATSFTIDWNGKGICLTEAADDPDKFSLAIRDVLFAEWLYHRSRWLKARELLCNMACARIKEQRAKAEADFDHAIAVSADGTKIVCADEVVVVIMNPVDKSRKLLSFPASAFMAKKILRAEKIQRDDAAFHDILFIYAKIINDQAFFVGGVPQALFDSGSTSKPRVFVTEERFCPSPLPDGGVELK